MAREDLHFRLRIPEHLKNQIEDAAERNSRSMTAEIIARIEESFQDPVILPEGLRDRVRLYAERHERTLAEEVLRLLDREFPVQWPVEDRLDYLADMLAILKTGAKDDRIGHFMAEMEETLDGLVSGKVTGVDIHVRDRIAGFWSQYRERENWPAYEREEDRQSVLDEEEIASLERNGTTEKFAEPLPERPNPIDNQITLMSIVPSRHLQQFTERLAQGDLEGAASIVRQIPKEELEERIAFEKLPKHEQYRLRGEEPPASGEDPFLRED